MAGGTGTGLGQDATVQQMLLKLGLPIPQGGTGTGLAQDATLQKLLAALPSGGSAFIPTFLLQPGGTPGPNTFTTWASLYAAAAVVAGGVRVLGDDSLGAIHITAGTWNIDNWTLDGEASFTNTNGGPIYIVDDGAVLEFNTLTIGAWVYMVAPSATTSPVTLSTGECNVYMQSFSAVNATGANPFFNVTGTAAAAFLWLHMENASLGDSTHTTINLAAGAGGQINMVSSEIHADALGGAGIGGMVVFYDSASNVETPNGAATLRPTDQPFNFQNVMFYGADPTGVADSSTAFQNALNAGNTFIPDGKFKIASPLSVPSNRVILGAGRGRSIIQSTITPTAGHGGFSKSVFFAQGNPGVASTLAATPALRSRSLSSNASFPVGSTILLSTGGNVAQQFTVESVTGTGPFSITTDDPILASFVSTNAIQQYSVPSNIVIEGLTFTGTGDRAIELAQAVDCIVRDCDVNPSAGTFNSIVMSFDLGGRRNLHDNIHVDQTGGSAQGGCALESNSFSTQRNIVVQGITATTSSVGIFWPTPMACQGFGLTALACYNGMQFVQSDATDTNGPIDCNLNGLTVEGSTGGTGISQTVGQNMQYANISTNANAGDGMVVGAGTTGSPEVTISNFSASANTGNGLNVSAGSAHVLASNIVTSNNGGFGVIAAGNNSIVSIDGFLSTDDVSGPWTTGFGGGGSSIDFNLKRGRARNVALNGFWTPSPTATGTISLDDYVVEYVAGTGVKAIVDVDAATTYVLRAVRTIGALTYGVYAGNGVACTIRIGDACDFTSCSQPTVFDATSRHNRNNSIVSNGSGSAQATAWAALNANDDITTRHSVAGGTPGAGLPLVVATAGVGWSTTFAATDTSTYIQRVA